MAVKYHHAVDDILRALAEPSRRAILSLVRYAPLCPTQIAAHFAVTRPAISQHIKVLRDAGLLSEQRDGTRRFYQARPQGMIPLRGYIERFREGDVEVEPPRMGKNGHDKAEKSDKKDAKTVKKADAKGAKKGAGQKKTALVGGKAGRPVGSRVARSAS